MVFKLLLQGLVGVLLWTGLTQIQASQPNPRELLRQMEAVMRGDASYFEMTMTLQRPRYTREYALKGWEMGQDYSLILITAPARDAGTVFLKRQRDIWNYVPTIDRTIKMPPSMMSQAWMGSDFSNDDLVRDASVIDDYHHRLLREEPVDGRIAWVVELIPKPDTAIVWGRVLMWIDQQTHVQLRIENHDQDGQLASTLVFSDIGELGGRLLPRRMQMTPADRPDQHTLLEYQAADFNPELDERFFTRQNMQRVR
ncbi:outer membrane lipoprotein-sorting protein [Marinospirillum alkaliphilum]|uniref:Outer membrane lipoprotein-sorting protein n=1 Tax=Marinospirillum alkaliphilum DSM 21637 TaxID=1122209 RepID=A0A1K1XEC2_9GAMM|nr:outer membrane lipoprotein-sorting protein [Marinospirillum alkaliphilum]SFX48049.1 Outer membrane lipoprotein-sorting protein [Marinospirillum alkaliphilum DSM 21637]